MTPRSRLTSKQSKRFVERKKLRMTLTIVLLVICAGTFGFSLVKFVNLNAFDIQDIHVTGADNDISAKLEASALEAIQGRYLGLFSKSSSLLYPAQAVKDSVLKSSPRIAGVSVSRQGLRGLAISVTEKSPAALVCANLPDFEGSTLSFGDSDDCYFTDDSGYIYGSAPSFSGDIYNRFYIPDLTDSASSSDIVGTFATSTGEFVAWQGIFASLKKASIGVQAMLVDGGGEYEIYARNPNGGEGTALTASSTDNSMIVIYFNDSRPFTEQIANLLSFWKNMTDGVAARHQKLSFEYIDVRYGSNVFYRLNK